jgi:hypothetical protein
MKKNNIASVVVFLLFLTGCQTSAPVLVPEVTTPYILSEQEKKKIELEIVKSLKDPDSARFGAMVAAQKNKTVIYVCGAVNAKNSFGGYVGNKLFLGILGKIPTGESSISVFNLVSMGGGETQDNTVLALCKNYGVL